MTEADQFDFNDRKKFRDMTKWFSPIVLAMAAKQAITTTIFSSYSDRRLTEAAMDAVSDDVIKKRHDFSGLKRDSEGAFWIDYVADLGDGFNSTYSVAYLLAKKFLSVSGHSKPLPRGQILIMGGDEVYPAATRDDYKYRMEDLYKYAFPKTARPDADHPSIFMIPGNHDWYDGLSIFLAKFCAGRDNMFLGSWRISEQSRSYFSIKLPDNWYIWGFDSQVDDADIDEPQNDYFTTVAEELPDDAKIIICASVPSWLKADLKSEDAAGREEFFKSLDFIAHIPRKAGKNPKIHLVLSGDTHHYNRYSDIDNSLHFITSGGGGAFLHPTHHLVDEYAVSWLGKSSTLSLKAPYDGENVSDAESCYPSRETSRKLSHGAVRALKNVKSFCLF